jgi:hypothetical protein
MVQADAFVAFWVVVPYRLSIQRLMVEALRTSETLLILYYKPGNCNHCIHSRENLKS